MRILFAGDHAGFELKRELMEYVKGLGHEVVEIGPRTYDPQDDYPDFVIPMAKQVASESAVAPTGKNSEVRGLITAGSGEGEAIAANRVKGARAVVYYGGDLDVIKATREHNNSNILALGARFLSLKEAKAAVDLWLAYPYTSDERHVRRLNKIEDLTRH